MARDERIDSVARLCGDESGRPGLRAPDSPSRESALYGRCQHLGVSGVERVCGASTCVRHHRARSCVHLSSGLPAGSNDIDLPLLETASGTTLQHPLRNTTGPPVRDRLDVGMNHRDRRRCETVLFGRLMGGYIHENVRRGRCLPQEASTASWSIFVSCSGLGSMAVVAVSHAWHDESLHRVAPFVVVRTFPGFTRYTTRSGRSCWKPGGRFEAAPWHPS